MPALSLTTRWSLYIGLNVAFSLVVLAGAALNGGSLDAYPYVVVLFAICASPILSVERFNGPFTMLAVAMAVYFVEFGALDAVQMIQPPPKGPEPADALGRTEFVLWIGAVVQILGFQAAVRLSEARDATVRYKDWSPGLLVPLGLVLWAGALAASLYHGLVVQVENTSVSVQEGLAKLGIWRATGLIAIENYAGPLGIMILAYWWAVWGKRSGGLLILLLSGVQFAVGWVVDTKEIAISAPVVALLTRFIVVGRLPMRWLVGAFLAIALVFPILTAKRVVTTEEMHLNRIEALPRTFEILTRTLQERDALRQGKYEQRTETFLERQSVKANVHLIVEGMESGHGYKMGATFEPLLYAFFPRVLWSDKPGGSSAQLLNREFHISADPDTFISPSHLGEWYWNFGLGGVVVGMALAGGLIGFVSARFDPSRQTSVTRVLVIIVTLYLLVARSEGQVEVQYVLWARSMALIGLLHLFFAHRPLPPPTSDGIREGAASLATPQALARTPTRFPNLLN